MNLTKMLTVASIIASTTATSVVTKAADATTFIGKQNLTLKNDRLTPEVLWAMGRIGNFAISPTEKAAVYNVAYYSVPENKSHQVLYSLNLESKSKSKPVLLTTSKNNERNAVYIKGGSKLAFLSNESGTSQVWEMNPDGTARKQLSTEKKDISEFLLSPDEKKIILIYEIETDATIRKNPSDLQKASGFVATDLMYKHWDQYITSIPHPFVAHFDGNAITDAQDILENEPYECPMLPFGGIEQLAWSPNSKSIAYTCRKKIGKSYAVSTDSDIYLYDLTSGATKNLCKPANYSEPKADLTHTMQNQVLNKNTEDCNMGYDTNPQFSPDGKYVAWCSMERVGYESDRTRLCVFEIKTGKKGYVTENFESGVDAFCWAANSKELYFSGVWHATAMIYRTNLNGEIKKLTNDICDYSIIGLTPSGKELITKRHSISQADEVYFITAASKGKTTIKQVTFENQHFYSQLTFGAVKERWIKTTDGKEEQCWIIYPPHFDPSKKYPTLLYCEGGPQSPVSQFWSFRWNFQIMAAGDYIIVAPNRRGLPGYGMKWLEQISGDYAGQCMQDYLSAIDDVCKEPYVDTTRLGCVGASFGGYSVYWLAGHHEGRFKCFIAHDGIYNTQQQYVETEELWFPNWDLKCAPWEKINGETPKVYTDSPHLSADKWDTPILCIHGQKDYRILASQAESAFTAAQIRGVPSELLLFPDENHWVLKPQNGILWQRTFRNWLDRWLK
ncbi:MAG: S9 family peptidase [Bacteroidaceae bacterium]